MYINVRTMIILDNVLVYSQGGVHSHKNPAKCFLFLLEAVKGEKMYYFKLMKLLKRYLGTYINF